MLSTRAAESILRAVAPRAGDLQEDAVQRLAHHEAQYELTRIALSWVRKEVLEPEHRQACEAAALAVQAARNAFVAANLGLVTMIARRYERGHLSFADLIQEGNTGLLKAVDRFDPERGHRFSTYAVWWIRHAIGRALSDKSREIRLPVHVVEQQHTVLRARADFEGRQGRLPTAIELAEQVGLPRKKIEMLLSLQFRPATAPKVNREHRVLDVDELAAPDPNEIDLDQERLAMGLRRALAHLSELEGEILRRRFGLDGDSPMTLREVGELHDLSRERIRQLQERALSRLRREFSQAGLA